MTLITEIHSGDVTASCLRQVQRAQQGHRLAEMPTAMYRGNWAGKVLEYLHRDNMWNDDSFQFACAWATDGIQEDLVREKRQLTQSVIDNREAIHKEAAAICQQYMIRFGERFKQCKLIGCELPIRWTLTDRSLDKPAECASHLDLLFRVEQRRGIDFLDDGWPIDDATCRQLVAIKDRTLDIAIALREIDAPHTFLRVGHVA